MSWSGYEFTRHPRPTYRRLREMTRTDGTMRAMDHAIQTILRSVTPLVEPGSDQGEKEADLVRRVLLSSPQEEGMTTKIADVQANLAMSIRYGITFFEKVWTRNSNREYVIKKLAPRPVWDCRVIPDKNGSFGGFHQFGYRPDGTKVDVKFPPILSFVFIRGQHESMLEGVSALEPAYHHWLDKKDGVRLWKEQMSSFAMGFLIGKYPRSSNATIRGRFMDALKSLRGSGRAAIPNDAEVDILRSAAGGEFKEFMDYQDAQSMISTLTQMLRLGQQPGSGNGLGGVALSTDHKDLFLMSMEAELNLQAEAMTEYIAAPLVFHNYGQDAVYPKVKFPTLSENERNRALAIWQELVKSRGLEGAVYQVLQEVSLESMGIDNERINKAREDKIPDKDVPGDVQPENEPPSDSNGGGTLSRAQQALQRISGG